ncbi:phospho-N-acetylmuramoyl-pentapeptide-transferase [bacterium]|nr:phospho-N-acetylmuramoyl-pentapeptide-transferase [bacterium]
MFYHLVDWLALNETAFRVFQYISFRVFLSILTALSISLFLGPPIIRYLKRKQGHASNVREDVPQSHQKKSGTPTMGGMMIILSIVCASILWARLDIYYIWLMLACVLFFGLIGFIDDTSKVKKTKGMTAKVKFIFQWLCAAFFSIVLWKQGFDLNLQVPFIKDPNIVLPVVLFIIFSCLVIVATSNAVNLTDGLDGLAIGPILVAAGCFLIFSYLAGHDEFSSYLNLYPVPGAGELCVFFGAMLGAGLGFLWYNTYPAQVFMGDVGSLSLGASLGLAAVIVKQELLLFLVGGIFVLETVSVIIQVISFKLTGKRVFKMAPVHHHFELKGWAEPKVIVRFWIIAIVLALLSLTTLKLR